MKKRHRPDHNSRVSTSQYTMSYEESGTQSGAANVNTKPGFDENKNVKIWDSNNATTISIRLLHRRNWLARHSVSHTGSVQKDHKEAVVVRDPQVRPLHKSGYPDPSVEDFQLSVQTKQQRYGRQYRRSTGDRQNKRRLWTKKRLHR